MIPQAERLQKAATKALDRIFDPDPVEDFDDREITQAAEERPQYEDDVDSFSFDSDVTEVDEFNGDDVFNE